MLVAVTRSLPLAIRPVTSMSNEALATAWLHDAGTKAGATATLTPRSVKPTLAARQSTPDRTPLSAMLWPRLLPSPALLRWVAELATREVPLRATFMLRNCPAARLD